MINQESLIPNIISCLILFLFFAILDRIYPKSIGGGDVKLLLILVMAYGFMGIQYILLIACITVLIRWFIWEETKFQFIPHITTGAIIYSLFL